MELNTVPEALCPRWCLVIKPAPLINDMNGEVWNKRFLYSCDHIYRENTSVNSASLLKFNVFSVYCLYENEKCCSNKIFMKHKDSVFF